MTVPELLDEVLALAPDPALARVTLDRVTEHPEALEALSDPEALRPAARLLGLSTAAGDFLAAHPEEAGLFADLVPRSRVELLAEARDDVGRFGPEAGLRRFRRRALYRVAARDLGGEAFEPIVAEITDAAESCLEVGLGEAGMAGALVLGMGKLGGRELNYASDVDIVFVHESMGGDAQESASRAAARVIALLSEPTGDGVALRVDVTLRPEGRAGALSRSLDATVDYYRRHAATWEKQALLKARPVAGEITLGEQLLDALESVIYPEHLEPSTIEEVRHMKVRVEEYVRARGKEAVEVKRGRGGIRDVEFAVQLLQLVHGRRDQRLREPNTLRALSALGEEGYVATEDAEALGRSYRFLRALEHRLQLAREIQTHELPEGVAGRTRLARSMGLEDAGVLAREYAEHTDIVRGLHERLFYRPLLEAFSGPRAPRPGTEQRATEELLEGLGFSDPAAAYEAVARLVDPGTRLGKVLGHVFPVVAPALALSANPNSAVIRFERVTSVLDELAAEMLASNPDLARRLAAVVGASSWASDRMAQRSDALELLSWPGDPDEVPEDALLRAAVAYAAGDLKVPESGRVLARVADSAAVRAVDAAAPSIPVAVVGLGRLGGEDLNFASDLDLVFVYDGEGAAAFEAATGAAEAILEGIRAQGYEVDARLRPEGTSGPLARSMPAYLEYWERWGQTWEFQALLKARFVAGDETLGRRFLSAAEDFSTPEVLPLERVAEIRKMRMRMERERVRPADAARFHFKLGYGGIADITFSVELAQLRHGREHPGVRRRHTLEALEALAEEKLIEDTVALALGEAYVFLNEVKNALEIDRRIRAESIPPSPEAQSALARRLGYGEYPRHRFLEDYRRVTRRARRAMERVFYGDESE